MTMDVKNDHEKEFDAVSLAESFPQGIMIIDTKTQRIAYGNEMFYDIAGVPKKEFPLHAAELFQFVHDDDRDVVSASVAELLSGNAVKDIELKMTNSDKIVSCSAAMMKGSSNVAVFVQDITRAREHKDYIVSYGAKKDTLLEMLAHHISGPLSLSRQILSQIENKSLTLPEFPMVREVSLIKDITAQCIDFISDFLKEEHLVSQNILVKHDRFDVVKIVDDIVSQYNASYPDRDLAYSGVSSLIIRNDDVKMMQILNNLISNSVKFTHVRGRIHVEVDTVGNEARITVSDNGIGIPESMIPQIFEKFTTAGRPGLNGEKTVGLGLSIVKRLTHLMDGKVLLRSKVGEGTVVEIILPRN